MIQRIQSLFLLLASGSAFSLFGLPFASTNQADASSNLFQDSLYNIHDHVGLIALFCLAGGLAFIGIFLFKNRKTQLLVGRLALVANIIGIILAAILMMNDGGTASQNVTPNDELGMFAPIVFLIFGFLALRFINKDEKLVKSMEIHSLPF